MNKITLTLAAAALLFAASCNNSPNADDAGAGDALATQEATGATLNVDLAASTIAWIGSKPIGKQHNGTIGLKEGTLSIENNTLTGGNFVLDFNTLTPLDQDSTGNAKLKGHLLAPDFLDATQFPEGSFQIVSVTAGVDTATVTNKAATHMVSGNLTLKGVTKSISFPAQIHASAEHATATATFNIDRTQWGINYESDASLKDKFINNEINFTVNIVAHQ
jgi:polyisoprenoid-binding protein YceI